MAVQLYNPTTPARRGMTTQDMSAITKQKPAKSLIVPYQPTSGRNNQGKITVRHRGGGVKRFYRLVDFNLRQGKATVAAIEYDPGRSARIALLDLADGGQAYVLASNGMKVGDKIEAGTEAEIRRGNRLALRAIPVGTTIYNVELVLGKGGAMARSAGAGAQLVAKEENYGQVKLPSGEVRLVHLDCQANIGSVGNEAHQNIKWGKAGRRRKMGWRPQVLGKSMNPVDHSHGGGEGHQSIGIRKGAKTPWGKPALGLKTRNRKSTDSMVVRGRKAGRRG